MVKYNKIRSGGYAPRCIRFRVHLRKFFECCVRPTEAYWWKQSFSFIDMPLWTPLMSLVVTSWPLACTGLPGLQWEHIISEWVQIFQNSWLEKYCAHACILLGRYMVRTAHDKWQSPKTDFRTELKFTFLESKPDPLLLLLHIYLPFTRHEETPSARVLCLVYNFSILATPQHKRQCKVSIQNVWS